VDALDKSSALGRGNEASKSGKHSISTCKNRPLTLAFLAPPKNINIKIHTSANGLTENHSASYSLTHAWVGVSNSSKIINWSIYY
jgi:hypothetical protein